MRTIVLVNHSTDRQDITAAWLHEAANVLALQAQRHFCPAYDLAPASVVPKGAERGDVAAELCIFDVGDDPRIAGYHDRTSDGRPYGRAFAGTGSLADLLFTLSHELLELLGNPDADEVEFGDDAHPDVGVYHEVCDPIGGTGYVIEGWRVSNFVLPAWFEAGAKGPYDFCKVLKAPLTRLEGDPIAYIIKREGGAVTTDPPEMAERKGDDPSSRYSKIVAAHARAGEATEPAPAEDERTEEDDAEEPGHLASLAGIFGEVGAVEALVEGLPLLRTALKFLAPEIGKMSDDDLKIAAELSAVAADFGEIVQAEIARRIKAQAPAATGGGELARRTEDGTYPDVTEERAKVADREAAAHEAG